MRLTTFSDGILAAALVVAAGSLAQAAEPADRVIANHQAWQVDCTLGGADTKPACTIASQSDDDAPQRLSLSAVFRAGSGWSDFTILTPLGVLVADGASLGIDGRPLGRAGIRSCHSYGCIIPLGQDPRVVNGLAAGRRLTVRMTRSDGTAIRSEISLLGFTAARSDAVSIASGH